MTKPYQSPAPVIETQTIDGIEIHAVSPGLVRLYSDFSDLDAFIDSVMQKQS